MSNFYQATIKCPYCDQPQAEEFIGCEPRIVLCQQCNDYYAAQITVVKIETHVFTMQEVESGTDNVSEPAPHAL